MPKTEASEMEFVLKEAGNQVYSVKYSLDNYKETTDGITKQFAVGSPGIMSFTVPTATGIPPMAIGKVYQWELTVMCDSLEKSASILMKGDIKRVEPNPTLARRLQQATPEERVTLYTQENLWYNAVATLVELGRDRPNDPKLAATWDQLLKSQGL
jgi:hypothetical protein